MSDDNWAGSLNLNGTRPGGAFGYEGPISTGGVYIRVAVRSTYEAIERLVLPTPLKASRDVGPILNVTYFIKRHDRGFDGIERPYQGFLFTAMAEHGGLHGQAGWEYVDSIRGDKSDVEIMAPWGIYFGMLKKLADIRFFPVSIDEFEVTVTRRGAQIAAMRFRLGEQLGEEALVELNRQVTGNSGVLTVREIPDAAHTGFVDHAVYLAPTDANVVTRAWTGDAGFLELRSSDRDPLAEIPVLGVENVLMWEATLDKKMFSDLSLVERVDD